MKLKTVILKNFRSYLNEIRIDLDPNLTALIGKNDIGKSTILEALEIFFNSESIKIEPNDSCVYSSEKEVRIGCVFTELPSEIIIDATAKTTLKKEYLLNPSGDLEIYKVYDCSLKNPKESVRAYSMHPSVPKANDLLGLKNAELKKRIDDLGIDKTGLDIRKNSAIRQSIWGSFQDLQIKLTEVPLDSEDGKRIWEGLKKELPVYALFQADRPSKDEDSEVQDPMKLAISQAIKEVAVQLEEIKEKVKISATEVAQRTIDKMREMDPSLSNELTPNFKMEPKWDNIFKLSLTGDDDIPINKRGSGVRRLILLNFFRAEAERKQFTTNSPGIIYAIEEPETSQHPNNQKSLVEALIDLSQNNGCQVLLTTHIPGLAGYLPLNSLRYIEGLDKTERTVKAGSNDVYEIIAKDLGITPDNRLKVFICVEGPNDVKFLSAISKVLHNNDNSIPNLEEDNRVTFIILGGNTLNEWVQKHYLKELGRPEVHLFDRDNSDNPTYQAACDLVNSRGDGSYAYITKKLELENYLHPDAIKEVFGITISFGDNDDVPTIVAQAVHNLSESKNDWASLTQDNKKKKCSAAKKRLNAEVAAKMTVERLKECDPEGELENWLREIATRLS